MELDTMVPTRKGEALQRRLARVTGRTTVSNVFIGGEAVGGRRRGRGAAGGTAVRVVGEGCGGDKENDVEANDVASTCSRSEPHTLHALFVPSNRTILHGRYIPPWSAIARKQDTEPRTEPRDGQIALHILHCVRTQRFDGPCDAQRCGLGIRHTRRISQPVILRERAYTNTCFVTARRFSTCFVHCTLKACAQLNALLRMTMKIRGPIQRTTRCRWRQSFKKCLLHTKCPSRRCSTSSCPDPTRALKKWYTRGLLMRRWEPIRQGKGIWCTRRSWRCTRLRLKGCGMRARKQNKPSKAWHRARPPRPRRCARSCKRC